MSRIVERLEKVERKLPKEHEKFKIVYYSVEDGYWDDYGNKFKTREEAGEFYKDYTIFFACFIGPDEEAP